MSTLRTPSQIVSVEKQVLKIIRELLQELGSHQALKSMSLDSLLDRELGLGSLERVELLVRIENAFPGPPARPHCSGIGNSL